MRPLVLALVALALLTITSYALAQVFHLGAAGTPVALAIAVVKASIVAIVFMELRRASTTVHLVVFVVFTFIALLSAGTVADLAFR